LETHDGAETELALLRLSWFMPSRSVARKRGMDKGASAHSNEGMFTTLLFKGCVRFALCFLAMAAGVHAQDNPFGGSTRTSGRNPFKDDSGSKPTETNEHVFDVSRVNATRTLETPARFAKIWAAFRTQHALGSDGEFVREAAATAPDNAETQAAFLRYVAANSPVVRLESEQKCKACTNGKKPATRGLEVIEVECTKCEGQGSLLVVDNYQLTYTGVVPAKPAPKVAAPAPDGAKPVAEAKPATVPGSRADEYRMLVDRIMVLGKRFNIERDEFSKELKYTPLAFASRSSESPSLNLVVLDEGDVLFYTRYLGRDWIFHDHFSLKVGDKIFDSAKVKPSTKVLRGAVLELCFYPGKDLPMAEAIANSPQSEVMIRLFGSEGNATRELEKDEKSAFRDAFELSAILKKVYKLRKADGIKGKIGDDSK